MKGYYADTASSARLIDAGNPLHYEVFEVPVPEGGAILMYCISTLQTGCVGDECYMTKGHYHSISATAEIYLCLRGEWCMLIKTADGRCEAQKMARGQMVYVPPFWAHHSINTGAMPLVSFCVSPAEAGHNYGNIATEGFPKRVFIRNGKVVIK